MSLPTSVADVIQQHVSLTVECVDRLYLNVIQSRLQVERGIAYFFQQHRGERFATAKTMAEVTRPFVAAIEQFAQAQGLDLVTFGRRRTPEPGFPHEVQSPLPLWLAVIPEVVAGDVRASGR